MAERAVQVRLADAPGLLPMKLQRRVTARKYMGDDRYSWAVFLDGRPIVTGLSRDEVRYWKRRILEEATKGGRP